MLGSTKYWHLGQNQVGANTSGHKADGREGQKLISYVRTSPPKKEKREPKPPFRIEHKPGLHGAVFSVKRNKTQQA